MKKVDDIADRYNRIRFGCESLFWKQIDNKTVKAWCAECDKKCSCKNCNKVIEETKKETL